MFSHMIDRFNFYISAYTYCPLEFNSIVHMLDHVYICL